MNYLHLFLSATLVGLSLSVNAQSLNFTLEAEAEIINNISGLTPVIDKLGREYLYVTANEDGLKIYDVSSGLTLVTSVTVAELTMKAMSVTQVDTLLYVAIGSHFGFFGVSNDPAGMAIVNVADPANPQVLDVWTSAISGKGAGIVRVQDDYAYLGAMPNGLIILDVSDPFAIDSVSNIIPPADFPHVDNVPSMVNARGMYIVDTLVYLCNDAGGMHVINCGDISNPVIIDMFANPITFPLFNWPRAYNNVIIDDTLAYIAVDYCGLEIWNVKDPYNVEMVHHWNPRNCPIGQWSEAPVHANELFLQKECNLLFMSTGKSELVVLDIADPNMPFAIDSFGTVFDTTGSWGVDVDDNFVYLTYVKLPLWLPDFLVPFYSTWAGVKKIGYTKCTAKLEDESSTYLQIFPNPAIDFIEFSGLHGEFDFAIISMLGERMYSGKISTGQKISTIGLSQGVYIVQLVNEKDKWQSRVFVK